MTYSGFTPITTTLASNVALDGTGHASYTSAALSAGQHWITVTYSGKLTGKDAMSGKAMFGSLGEGTWTAKKKP